MKSSSRFFENRDCEFFPCHAGGESGPGGFNCLFCFCPLYSQNCPGNFRFEGGLKDCSSCLFPHRRENYDRVIDRLRNPSVV
ncbi:MAG: cysteine-rich small domain-containing protein [Spirochaetales bacterium]|nr:cysteine-rich small domain-containing protein [Spirochaetales bacterium]